MSAFGQPGYVPNRKNNQQSQMYTLGSSENFYRAANEVPQEIGSLEELWNYMQNTYGYSNEKLSNLVTAFSISSRVVNINNNVLDNLIQPDLEKTNATPARDILFTSAPGKKKQAIRDYLEHWDPDQQCKKFDSAYFEKALRTNLEAYIGQILLQNSLTYQSFKNGSFTTKTVNFQNLAQQINTDILNLIISNIPGNIKQEGWNISNGIHLYPMIDVYCNQFNIYNPAFPCFGIYNMEGSTYIEGTNIKKNSGKCWLCQNYIPFYIGFVSLTKNIEHTRLI